MIKILKVGKVKRAELTSLSNYYLKQIPRKVEVITVRDESVETKKHLEAKNILKQIKETDYVITLEIKGKQITSEELALKLENLETSSKEIVFVIGGSFGLDDEVIKRSDFSLSFSNFTFPHQLMFLILTEQIFRAYSIVNNKQYHK